MNAPSRLIARVLSACCVMAISPFVRAQADDPAAEAIRATITEARATKDFLAASIAAQELVHHYAALHRLAEQAAAYEESLAFLKTIDPDLLTPREKALFPLARLMQTCNLRPLYVAMGRLALAEKTQADSEQTVGLILAMRGKGERFSFSEPTPLPATITDPLAKMILGVRNDRAELLEYRGETLLAVKLLRQDLAAALRMGNVETRDRSRNNLAAALSTLGYDEQPIELYRAIVEAADAQPRSKALARIHLVLDALDYSGPAQPLLDEARQALADLQSVAEFPAEISYAEEAVALVQHRLGEHLRAEAELQGNMRRASRDGEEHRALSLRSAILKSRLKLGTRVNEQALVDLLQRHRAMGRMDEEPGSYSAYGFYLQTQFRLGEAIYMYQHALALFQRYGWSARVPLIMAVIANCYQSLGHPTEAAARWLEVDAYLAAHPDLPANRKLEVLNQKIEYHLARGDSAEARKGWTAAMELARSKRLPEYLARGLQRAEPSPEPPKTIPPVTVAEPAAARIDLQPLAARSRVAPGETLRAQFTLTNLSNAPARGSLSVAGPIQAETWDQAGGAWKIIFAPQPSVARKLSSPVEAIMPGAQILIRLEAPSGAEADPQELATVLWQPPSGAPALSAAWTTEVSASRTRHAVTQASLLRRSPFYAVPVYHEILRRGEGRAARNYRIVASQPCRIEVVAGDDRHTVAIDSEGNGRFGDPGDVLVLDRNRDGYPDFVIAAEAESTSLELLVSATGDTTSNSITLQYQLQVGPGWETYAEDWIE